ncbi:hypothetical protein BDR05DRAFT_1038665 [Suillus weaverae]|nr:hypothetical protein BDR05DRAFT_1038665 [Suillus weaverae]
MHYKTLSLCGQFPDAAIAKRVSDALLPLTIEQAYTGVDYGKKGIDFTVALPRFKLLGKPDELAKKVITDMQVSECPKRLGCMERHAFESYWRFGEILRIAEQERLQLRGCQCVNHTYKLKSFEARGGGTDVLENDLAKWSI